VCINRRLLLQEVVVSLLFFLIFRGVDIGRGDGVGSSSSILSLCEDVDKSGLFDAFFRLSLMICSEIAVGFSITTVSGDTWTS